MTLIPSWSIYTPSPAGSQAPEKFGVVGRLLQHLDAQEANPAQTDAKQNQTQALPPNNPPVDLLSKPSSQGRAVETVSFAEAIEPPVVRPSEGGLGPSQSALEAGRPPGQPGPFEVTKMAMTLGGNKVDVYLPKGRGPFPMNIYASGLSHGQRHATANANHFASWGILTVVPSLGGNIDPVKSGRMIEKIVSDLNQRKEIKGTAIQPEAIAVSGHSFGGLSASLAADHPAVKALLALDPNDNLFQMNPGRRNAPQVHVPAAFIFGDGGPNDQGPGIYHELSSPRKYALEFKNMPHDNFISTSEMPNKRGQQRALDFATAFLLHELGGLSATQPYLAEGSEIRAAIRNGELKPL
ncbi:MAG: hypothetical protein AB7I41_19425 [Candidatus Sericytochromatia bacterium]